SHRLHHQWRTDTLKLDFSVSLVPSPHDPRRHFRDSADNHRRARTRTSARAAHGSRLERVGQPFGLDFAFGVFAGSPLTYSSDLPTQSCAACAVNVDGKATYPPIGRPAGPKGNPPAARSASRSASDNFTPTSAPKMPMNMLPFTNAPTLPN